MSHKHLVVLLIFFTAAMCFAEGDLRSRLYKTTNDYASKYLLDPTIKVVGSNPDSRENKAIKDLTLAFMNPFASTGGMEDALGNFQDTMVETMSDGASGSGGSSGGISGGSSGRLSGTTDGSDSELAGFGIPWQLREDDFRLFLEENAYEYKSNSGGLHSTITLEKYLPILGSRAQAVFYFNTVTDKKVMYRVLYDFASMAREDDEITFIRDTSRLMSYSFGAPATDSGGTREALEGLNDWYDSYGSHSWYWELEEHTLNLYRASGAGFRDVCLDIRKFTYDPY